MKKFTSEQKTQLKELRKKLKSALAYRPMGQGDGFNQNLVIREIGDAISRAKSPLWEQKKD